MFPITSKHFTLPVVTWRQSVIENTMINLRMDDENGFVAITNGVIGLKSEKLRGRVNGRNFFIKNQTE